MSPESIRMIGDLLNEQSMMYTALTEMLYELSIISDKTEFSEVTGGTDKLSTVLSEKLKELGVSIHLDSPVKSITHSDKGVIVSYLKDYGSTLTALKADFVLVTSTTKATRFIDFNPPLSVKKMDTLRSVHYDSASKIVLTFSEKFWEKDGIHGGKSITNRPTRYIYYPSHSFPGNDKIGVLLASYTWSDDSLLYVGMSDEDLKEMALKDLSLIHGRDVRPLCTGIIVKKWTADPYSMGAYALFTPYQQVKYLKELFRSEGRVHFAGEHTALPHGWIEAAMKSGIRAAKNINNAAAKEPFKPNPNVVSAARDEF